MFNKIFKRFNEKDRSESKFDAIIKSESGPILKVILGSLHLATIYFDGTRYCLVYHSDFTKANIAPFNSEELSMNSTPEIDKCYYSEILWHSFSSRIPSKERADYLILMSKLGLTGTENPLFILSKIGSVSISKPWRLELVKNNRVS